jgi:hypothetical protein
MVIRYIDIQVKYRRRFRALGDMMATRSAVLMFFLISVVIVPSIHTAEAFDFSDSEWGFEEGSKFNYTLRMRMPLFNIDILEKVTVIIEYAPSPLTTIDSGSIPPFNRYYLWWMTWRNGTATGYTMRLPGLGEFWSAVPVGNWSVLDEMYNVPEIIRLKDSLSSWGFTLIQKYGETTAIRSYTYSKTDGVIQRYYAKTTLSNGSLEYYVEMTRDGYVSDIVLIGGVVVAAIVILSLGFFVKRRKKLTV